MSAKSVIALAAASLALASCGSTPAAVESTGSVASTGAVAPIAVPAASAEAKAVVVPTASEATGALNSASGAAVPATGAAVPAAK